jgi:hypothetical protein
VVRSDRIQWFVVTGFMRSGCISRLQAPSGRATTGLREQPGYGRRACPPPEGEGAQRETGVPPIVSAVAVFVVLLLFELLDLLDASGMAAALEGG